MGLLSGIASGIGIVGGLFDGPSAKKTANKVVDAQTEAANANRALFERMYNQTRTDLEPGRNIFAPAVNAAAVRAGLAPMPAGSAPQAPQATNPSAYSAMPGARASVPQMGPQGGNPMRGNTAGGLPTPAPSPTPGDAPPGKRWVQGPEGWALLDERSGQTFGQIVGGKDRKTLGGPAGPLPVEPDMSGAGSPQAVAPATGAGGGVDYQRLFQDRPDVMAEYQKVSGQADPNSPEFQRLGLDRGAEGFADYWLQNKPAEDTYAAPTAGASPAAAGQPAADPNAPPAEYYQETYAARPDALAVPEFNRPTDLVAPTFGDGPQFSWDPSQIANDAGFKFETKEAAAGVNANAAARGALRSGGAVKALQDRLFGVAHTYGNDYFNRALSGYQANRNAFESNRGFDENRYRFGQGRQDTNFLDDRSYGTNLYTTLQNRNDDIFSQDRGFAANRNDQQNSNIFGLINVGQNAAAGTASAGNTFANATAAQNSNVADARSNAALYRAQNASNPFGSAAKLAGAYFGAI